jgi:site-specific recombinase XerD
MVAVLLDVGLRASELAGLQAEHVIVTTGDVYVVSGKGDTSRAMRLGQRARKLARRYWMHHRARYGTTGAFFLADDGEQLTSAGVHDITTKLGKRAGVFPCNPPTASGTRSRSRRCGPGWGSCSFRFS